MKKSLLLILFAGLFAFVQAQNGEKQQGFSARSLSPDGKIMVKPPQSPMSNVRSAQSLELVETQIGITWYDYQTNSMLDNRFHYFEDGTMGGVWTFGLEASSFPGRGTGYNYYDGTAWGPQPSERIESVRCGWPSYAPWGPTGEIVLSHDFAASELYLNKREVKGTGEWDESVFTYSNGPADLSWARIITSGENNDVIHLISNTVSEYLGQTAGMVYSRSTDGGESWDIENVILEGMGADDYFEISADDYTMASRGNTICILVGNTWMDLLYMRSDDNGETWEKQIVWEHPYPLLDPNTMVTDTFYCMDNTAQMTIDYQGHAHVVFGLTRAVANEDFVGWVYTANDDGIVYWNDMMEPFSGNVNALAPPGLGYEESELIVDENYIGWMQDVDGNGLVELEGIQSYRFSTGMSSMPTISVDQYGQRFVLFSSNTEGFVYTGGSDPVNYKHLWGRAYANTVWGDFMDLSGDISHLFDECYYATMAKNSDEYIHYIYFADVAPGTAEDGNHDYHDNFCTYAMLSKTDLITGIGGDVNIDESHVSQNYPNPFSDKTSVTVELEQAANLSLVVTSMTGQKVMEINRGLQQAGSHIFDIMADQLGSGIYFYTVFAGKNNITRKMIVE